MTLWLNGRLLRTGGTIDPADRGFTLGDGLFETIRAAAGRACQLDRHLARLRQGARVLELPLPWPDAVISAAIEAVLAADRLTEAAIRVTLTRGPAPRGVLPPATPAPTLLVTAGPTPPTPPVTAITATLTRRNEHSPLARIKSLNYLDNILARQEAARAGANEALLLNTAGRLAEASAANLFILLSGTLMTPPIAEGALPGIMRGLLIERCGAVERAIPPELLAAADSAFLSSSLGLRPLVLVNQRVVGDGGKIVERLAPIVLAVGEEKGSEWIVGASSPPRLGGA